MYGREGLIHFGSAVLDRIVGVNSHLSNWCKLYPRNANTASCERTIERGIWHLLRASPKS